MHDTPTPGPDLTVRNKIAAKVPRHGKAAVFYVAAFSVAKMVSAFGPLMLAKLYPADVYGAVELALSTSLFIAYILVGTVTSALPRLHLARTPIKIDDVLAAIVAAAGAMMLAGGAVALMLAAKLATVLCFFATVPALAQNAFNISFLTASMRGRAALAGSIAPLVATLSLVGLLVVPTMTLTTLTWFYASVGVIITGVAAVIAAQRKRPGFVRRLRKAVTTGAPMLLHGLVAAWIGASARIYMGAFLSVDAVAVYSFDYRIAALIFLPHSIMMSVFFARLFTMRTRPFDRLISVYLMLTIAASVVLVALFPTILAAFSPKALSASGRADALLLFPIVILQVTVLTMTASIYYRVNRAGLTERALIGTAVVAGGVGAAFLALHQTGQLTIHGAGILLALQEIGQLGVLLGLFWWRKLPLPRVAILGGAVSVAGLAGIAFTLLAR